MQPIRHRLSSTMNLAEALQEMRNNNAEALPVVESDENEILIGVLDQRAARRSVGAELVRRQTTAG
jgi:CBS domain-containing protein